MFCVKDFYSSVETTDTEAIQAAADAAHRAGGGTVFIPTGEYVVASVRLFSNTTVILEAGARLLMDPEESHYGQLRGDFDEPIARDAKTFLKKEDGEIGYLEGLFLATLRRATDCMFYAHDAENLTIRGAGVLDGQYPKFLDVNGENAGARKPRWMRKAYPEYPCPVFRPQFIVFSNCRNVTLRDFQLLNAPFYNIRILECDTVRCENLNLMTDKRCLNTDGINIAGSRNAWIRGCRFVTGDDCIALSCGECHPLKQDCENIVISDCIGDTTTNFVRIFSGIDVDLCEQHGICGKDELDVARQQSVRNVQITNCIQESGGCLLNAIAVYGKIEQVRASNLQLNHTDGAPAVFLAIQKEGSIRDVAVENLDSRAGGMVSIQGSNRESMREIRIQNCRFFVETHTKLFGNGMVDPWIDYWMASYAPYFIYVRHATDVTFQNCSVKWGEADFSDMVELAEPNNRPARYNALWRDDMNPMEEFPCISAYDVDGMVVEHLQGSGFRDGEAVKLERVERVTIQ